MKLSKEKISKVLTRCGYKNAEQVKDDALEQLARVIISNIQVPQPKCIIPYGYAEIKSGPSISDVHDFDDYEHVQRSFDRN